MGREVAREQEPSEELAALHLAHELPLGRQLCTRVPYQLRVERHHPLRHGGVGRDRAVAIGVAFERERHARRYGIDVTALRNAVARVLGTLPQPVELLLVTRVRELPDSLLGLG